MVERIIREHSADVTRFLVSRLYTPDRREDALDCCSKAAQILCEKYFMGHITPEDDADALAGYFYACAKNVAREENARYFRRQRLLNENLCAISENLFQDKDYIRDVLDAIQTIFDFVGRYLGKRELRILELHYREGYSFEEIAGRLDLKPANVRKIHERTIKKIRDIFSRFRGPDGPGRGRRSTERKSSKSTKPVSGTSSNQGKANIELSRQNYFDDQTDFVIQLLTNYGSICRDLDVEMFKPGALIRQFNRLNEQSININNSIKLTALLLTRIFVSG